MDAEGLRAYALALPEVEERETWGHPTFRVRDKMFLTLGADGEEGTVKATLADQAELVAQDPKAWSVPAYVGRHGWVGSSRRASRPRTCSRSSSRRGAT